MKMCLTFVLIILVHFCLGKNGLEEKEKDKNNDTFCLGGEMMAMPSPFSAGAAPSTENGVQLPIYHPMALDLSNAGPSTQNAVQTQFGQLDFHEKEDLLALWDQKNELDDQIKYFFNGNQNDAEEANANKMAPLAKNKLKKLPSEITIREDYGDQFLIDNESEVEILEKMAEKSVEKEKAKTLNKSQNCLLKIAKQVAESVEKFVGNSNKMWEKIKEQLAVVEMCELTEKQKALAADGHKGISKYNKIEADFEPIKSAFKMAGKTADTAVIGIGIALFLVGVEMEGGKSLEDFLLTKTRWIACQLVRGAPVFTAFARIIKIYGKIFNSKCRGNAEYAKECMGKVESFLGKKTEFQSDKSKMGKKLLNMDIYLRYLIKIDEMCQPFYGNEILNSLPNVQNLFNQIRFLVHLTAQQFSIFKEIAQIHGIEEMTRQICG